MKKPHPGIVARFLREHSGHCPACGKPIRKHDRVVLVRGKAHHRRCTFYRRR